MIIGDDFATRHVFGAKQAPITVLEYGDFECPFCAGAAPVLRDLVAGSGGQVRLVFRHFPLFTPHPHALTAALAAEAAGDQGAFWPMHDLLFARQHRLSDADLQSYGDELGLNTSCLTGDPVQSYAEAVQLDYAAGAEAGVHGTPTLFLNGDAYTGKLDVSSLRAAVARLSRAPRH